MTKLKIIICILISSSFLLNAKAKTNEENNILIATYNGNAYKIDLDISYYKNVFNKIALKLTGTEDAALINVSIDDVDILKKKSKAYIVFTAKSQLANKIFRVALIAKKEIGGTQIKYYFNDFFYKIQSTKSVVTDALAVCPMQESENLDLYNFVRSKNGEIIGCKYGKNEKNYCEILNGTQTKVYNLLGALLLEERID